MRKERLACYLKITVSLAITAFFGLSFSYLAANQIKADLKTGKKQ